MAETSRASCKVSANNGKKNLNIYLTMLKAFCEIVYVDWLFLHHEVFKVGT